MGGVSKIYSSRTEWEFVVKIPGSIIFRHLIKNYLPWPSHQDTAISKHVDLYKGGIHV